MRAALFAFGLVATASAARAAGGEAIPFREDEILDSALLLRTGIALALALAALAGVALLLRRLGPGRRAPEGSVIELLATRRLSPRSTVFLVRVGGREFLLGESEGGLRSLGESGATAAEAEPADLRRIGGSDVAA